MDGHGALLYCLLYRFREEEREKEEEIIIRANSNDYDDYFRWNKKKEMENKHTALLMIPHWIPTTHSTHTTHTVD